MSIIEKARQFATTAHEGQLYGNGEPYTWHLHAVASLAARLGYPANVIAASWLHDSVEDTPTTPEELAEEGFPSIVVDAVDSVTFIKGVDTDKISKAKSHPLGHVVKFCDSSVNYGASVIYGPPPGKAQDITLDRYLDYLEQLRVGLPTPGEIRDFEASYNITHSRQF